MVAKRTARTCCILVGLTFIVFALAKTQPAGSFERILIKQGLFTEFAAAAIFARLLIAFELSLGLALCQRKLLRRLVIPVTVLLLLAFVIYIIANPGLDDCGCGGELIPLTRMQTVLKNLVMLAMLAFAFCKLGPDVPGWRLPAGLALAALIAVPLLMPYRPPVEIAAMEFAPFIDLPTEPEPFDVTDGRCLLAMLNLDCEHCKEMARSLGELYADSAPALPLYFAFLGEPDLAIDFFAETETDFPYLICPDELFSSFIGNAPPRLYLLENGHVLTFWDEAEFSLDAVRERLGSAAVTPVTKKFAAFAELPTQPEPFDLTVGDCLAAFLNLDCDHCRTMATELGRIYREDEPKLPLYFVFWGDPETVPDFFGETETDFPYLVAGDELFFAFIGDAPPRLYQLRDGNAVTFWDEATFDGEQVRAAAAKARPRQ